jgi:prephenate dehydrogenase
MRIKTLTIVGVGLIGGSVALAAKRRGLAKCVIGAGRHQERLARALTLGAIDKAYTDVNAAVHQSELAVFCTPVDQIAEQVLAAAAGCSPTTVLTDAGSTKAQIVRKVESQMAGDKAFVGSHPLAGSEKSGVEHADASLFEGRLTIVTQTPRTNARALERVKEFWQGLGSRTCLMDPEEHDRALALTSHLPHLVASALAGILPRELHKLTATGFQDTTRVAMGDPSIWTAIFSQNPAALLEALQRLERRLDEFRVALSDADLAALDALLAQGKGVRDALGS